MGNEIYPEVMPHCDPRVLHKPGECNICDTFPELQTARKKMMINFTGYKEEGFGPCPADATRPNSHHLWPGNRPRRGDK